MEYTSIKIRKEFADELAKLINENPELGYRSISDFMLDATRRRIEEIKREKEKKN